MPPQPIVARRTPALVAIAAAVAVVAVLAGLTYHGASTSFDNWVVLRAYEHIGVTGAWLLLDLSLPALSFAVLAAVGIGTLVARRWDLLAVTVLGPALAILVSEEVLKPIVGRLIGPYVLFGSTQGAIVGSYPSGHETGVVAAAMVVFLVAGQLRIGTPWRVVLGVVLVLWSGLAALGLVRNFYHYATDTIGGIGVPIAVVLGTALAVDAVCRRYAPAGQQTRHPVPAR